MTSAPGLTALAPAKLPQAGSEQQSPGFRLDYLPPFSPNVNPIERFWKLTRRRRFHDEYFDKLDLLLAAVERHPLAVRVMSRMAWGNSAAHFPDSVCKYFSRSSADNSRGTRLRERAIRSSIPMGCQRIVQSLHTVMRCLPSALKATL